MHKVMRVIPGTLIRPATVTLHVGEITHKKVFVLLGHNSDATWIYYFMVFVHSTELWAVSVTKEYLSFLGV